jgi:hypothetical protein
VSIEDVARVLAVLDRGERRGRMPRVALLAGGRLVCETCTAPMSTARRDNGGRTYRCLNCYMQVAAEPLEELISDAVKGRLDLADLPAASNVLDRGHDLAELEDQLSQLAEDHGRGDLSRAEWLAARKPLQARIEAARQVALASSDGAALAGLTGRGKAGKEWKGLGLERQQAVIDAMINAVIVKPGIRRGPGLDHDRIDVRWKA